MSKNDLETLMDEALGNIRNDRKIAREFLNEIANLISGDPDQNKYLSPVAAKHIETLQRSNEQLVKIINIQSKKTETDFQLTDNENLFDLIQEEAQREEN